MRVTGGPSIICVAFALSVYSINASRDTADDVMRCVTGIVWRRAPAANQGCMYGVVAANSRVFSRVLIIDRPISEKLALLCISLSFFPYSFLFLFLAFTLLPPLDFKSFILLMVT